ncbi:hypothetical protein, unlikely [Trypanosoma brucei gambiense DAL972]|uniref:Uncharacterized protein n=1 Tax=Trypanosoma brucei gambiense (strain MHOM/CI/86/DAL972) TaxID=679716 RepID=C9ZJY1_TRYB9|nr:hypothetical protein, unlikely [Trypanosoma brucei gambiense DAL972]CBH09745.1 hypothetical protein, unlikely [Trypanosoma brucei gambiense DAL972]|eukprot:XP_011772038.1 hypothetical protein, unlikely [Trypanosoma brucei gambiense DAL972]
MKMLGKGTIYQKRKKKKEQMIKMGRRDLLETKWIGRNSTERYTKGGQISLHMNMCVRLCVFPYFYYSRDGNVSDTLDQVSNPSQCIWAVISLSGVCVFNHLYTRSRRLEEGLHMWDR